MEKEFRKKISKKILEKLRNTCISNSYNNDNNKVFYKYILLG